MCMLIQIQPAAPTVDRAFHAASGPQSEQPVLKKRGQGSTSANAAQAVPKPEPYVARRRSSLSTEGRTRDGFPIVGAGAYAGISTMRNKFAVLVQSELAKLKEDRQNAREDLNILGLRYREEKERLDIMTRELGDMAESQGKATAEYERAEGVLAAARINNLGTDTGHEFASKKTVIKICEALVKSWYVNAEKCRSSFSEWEIKTRHQGTIVTELHAQLEAAEATFADNVMNIDMDIANLGAVAELLQEL